METIIIWAELSTATDAKAPIRNVPNAILSTSKNPLMS